MIDKKIVNLLEKIGHFWSPAFSEQQLKNIAYVWQSRLEKYSDEILDKTLEELAAKYVRRPTLADFLSTAAKIKEMQAPISVNIYKSDFISRSQYRAEIAAKFGEKAAQKVDRAFSECSTRQKSDFSLKNFLKNISA